MHNPSNILIRALLAMVGIVVVAVIGTLMHLALSGTFEGDLTRHLSVEVLSDTLPGDNLVEEGIHVATGLVYGRGFNAVKTNCTNCHSAKLITQNRSTREGWHQMIRWMQETQGLWDLGTNEKVILDYLAEHYAPTAVGRRPALALESIEWYHLEE